MSKRRRRQREDARPADHNGGHGERFDEPKLSVSGEAFAQFDSWIDAELEVLVNRWVHLAAPRRRRFGVIPQDTRRPSGA